MTSPAFVTHQMDELEHLVGIWTYPGEDSSARSKD